MIDIIQKSKDLVRSNHTTEFHDRVQPSPPLNTDSLKEAEMDLFEQFPPLLQRIYSEVSNGGIGPGYGLIGFDGGTLDEGRSVLQTHQWFLDWSAEMETCIWPRDLVPITHMGCGIYQCIALDTGKIIDFDHHGWDETPNTWQDNFEEVSHDFTTWWESWLTSLKASTTT